jgi:hypothetical protein
MVMSVLFLAKLGYLLWEALILICLMLATMGWLVLRRKLSGRPAFSKDDRTLLFNTPPAGVPVRQLCLRFAVAVVLFSGVGALVIFVFAPLGAAILSLALLLSCAAIVNKTLL